MTKPIHIIQYGLGPIGCAAARLIDEREGLELVGAVDIDPKKMGRDVGEVIGLDSSLGVPVMESLSQVLQTTQAEIVMHTTNSYFDLFKSQILEILEAGLDTVSTSEELSFPWLVNKQHAEDIDALAKKIGKTVMATGVNPGFLMDSLPLFATSICQRVDRFDVTRRINASERRGPFQAKIGSGMTVEAFNAKMAAGRMGHVGLPESMGMLFDTLGKKLVKYESSVEPVVAEEVTKTDYFEVQPGQVKGLKQTAHGYSPEGEFATLTFLAALAIDVDCDTIKIFGKPDLEVTTKGTNGDLATVAIAVNAIRRVHAAQPGLMTMRDMPIVTAW